jgi:hypothetical protein
MAAKSSGGLTEQDLAELRELLATGKRPRVQLFGPHFPVATMGTVIRIGTPEHDGADHVRVRVKVNGMTDELAFSPTELRTRKAAAAAARPARPPARPRPAAKKAPARGSTDRAATDRAASAMAGGVTGNGTGAGTGSAGGGTADGTGGGTAGGASPRTPAAVSGAAARPVAGAAAVGRRRKASPMPKVSFTVSSQDASWAVSATRGTRSIVKGAPLAPGVVTELATLLDQAPLTEAIGEINTVALAEAQARADLLRAELTQLEAVLATHRRP